MVKLTECRVVAGIVPGGATVEVRHGLPRVVGCVWRAGSCSNRVDTCLGAKCSDLEVEMEFLERPKTRLTVGCGGSW